MNAKRFSLVVVTFLFGVWAQAATADGLEEPIPSFYQEPGPAKNRHATSGGNDRIDPFTGKLQWHYVDAYLPGNGGFDIKVQRSYSSLNETFRDRSPVGMGWTMHFGRVLRKGGVNICLRGQGVTVNPVLELADGSRHILYDSLDGTYAVSTGFWKASCNTDGHLIVMSPDGTSYEMTTQGAQIGTGSTFNDTWYPARIVDRNGNSLTLTYVLLPGPATGVASVSSSDSRLLTFIYEAGALKSISDGSSTWHYNLTPVSGGVGQFTLDSVGRPDGSMWRYNYNPPGVAPGVGTPGGYSMSRVVYPTGGFVDYTYNFVNFTENPNIPVSTVVTKKQASDGNVWTYIYRPATQQLPANAVWNVTNSCIDLRLDCTIADGPEGSTYYWNIGYTSAGPGWVYLIGSAAGRSVDSRLLGQTYVTRNEAFSWGNHLLSNQPNQRPGGTMTFDNQTFVPFMFERNSHHSGSMFKAEFGDFDEFLNPRTIIETGTDVRTTTLTYFTNPSKWILHLKKDETSSIAGTINRSFDNNGNLMSETRYGVATSYTYSQGDLATKTDARNFVTTYSSHYRGIPRSENHPANVSITREVSNAGNVLSETDGAGSTIGYTYDGLNRLTSITHPIGSPVSITWTPNTRTLTRGGYTETTTFDAFGRTIQAQHLGGSDTITQTFANDAIGRRTFASYPNDSKGTGYVYDMEGQLLGIYHGNLANTTTVSSTRIFVYGDHRMEMTNERGLTYKYTYRTYAPGERHLLSIETPEPTTNITMTRNGVGQVLTATQDGKTRTYTYDGSYFLREMNDPEVGTTFFGRDGIGNMSSRRVGTSGTTTYGYDGRNRLETVTYPGGTPSVTRTYYGDDKLHTIDNGVALRSYVYDANKNLKTESLTVAGHAPFVVGYNYNANDALDEITYGSGKKVKYAPDAFGRPTKAAPFVTAVTHHPGGQMATMRYVNGVRTQIGLNARHWPETMRIFGNVAMLANQTYDYDELGNVYSIFDTVDPANYNRSMDYDGVDRLTTANGSWGSGNVNYDGRGNITGQRLGANVLNYNYDPTTNRLSSVTGQRNFTYSYDAYGNVTNNGLTAFTYDDASNMRCVNCGQSGEVTYDYDGANMRFKTTKAGVPTFHIYGSGGNLLWEENSTGITEYIYLHGKQVATRQRTN